MIKHRLIPYQAHNILFLDLLDIFGRAIFFAKTKMLCSGFERASPLGPKAQEGEAVPGLLTWFKKMGLEARGPQGPQTLKLLKKTHFQFSMMDIDSDGYPVNHSQ